MGHRDITFRFSRRRKSWWLHTPIPSPVEGAHIERRATIGKGIGVQICQHIQLWENSGIDCLLALQVVHMGITSKVLLEGEALVVLCPLSVSLGSSPLRKKGGHKAASTSTVTRMEPQAQSCTPSWCHVWIKCSSVA